MRVIEIWSLYIKDEAKGRRGRGRGPPNKGKGQMMSRHTNIHLHTHIYEVNMTLPKKLPSNFEPQETA